MRGDIEEAWLVADGPTGALERELAQLGVRVRRIPMEHAEDALEPLPESAALLVQGAPHAVLAVLRRVRARGWKGRAAALTGPFDAMLFAELRPLADAIADRRNVGHVAAARLLGRDAAQTVGSARSRARTRVIAAALEESGGVLLAAAARLGTQVQNLRGELGEWEEDMRFLRTEDDHQR